MLCVVKLVRKLRARQDVHGSNPVHSPRFKSHALQEVILRIYDIFLVLRWALVPVRDLGLKAEIL